MILRGVLFDLDGTLGDHDASVREALTAWLPSLGLAYSAEVHEVWDALAEKHLAAWRTREITFAEQRRRRLRDFLGIHDEESELDAIFAGFVSAYAGSYRAFDDAFDGIAAARDAGLTVAVLTNGSSEQQNGKLARMGMTGIGPVWTPDDLGVAKPEPATFALACARWGIPAGQVLSVGDRHDLDVLPARVAGLRAVHLDRSRETEGHRIGSLRDLAAYLSGPGPSPSGGK
ncbi:HAD family hydrolase [Actinoplanes rectilineatus]|uniref:HAD family hydrolase n=1 Tax=Actinoplanes rectilineatus TaxID=113571 RepID=UPI0005F29AFE|nr:HAD family hydrolase [Actinoplanes rectilineatus]